MTTTERTIGQIVDGLGCVLTELLEDPDALPSAVVVLTKVIDAEGRVGLSTTWSDGMSWIERIGFLQAALHEELTTMKDED